MCTCDISSSVRIPDGTTISSNNLGGIIGKRIKYNTSLRAPLNLSPVGLKFRNLQLAAAHLLVALKIAHSPSTKERVSLLRSDDRVSRLIQRSPSLWRQAVVLASKICQQRCSRSGSENSLACSTILKTLVSLNSASKKRQQVSARKGTMYFFAKYSNSNTFPEVKCTTSEYK